MVYMIKFCIEKFVLLDCPAFFIRTKSHDDDEKDNYCKKLTVKFMCNFQLRSCVKRNLSNFMVIFTIRFLLCHFSALDCALKTDYVRRMLFHSSRLTQIRWDCFSCRKSRHDHPSLNREKEQWLKRIWKLKWYCPAQVQVHSRSMPSPFQVHISSFNQSYSNTECPTKRRNPKFL